MADNGGDARASTASLHVSFDLEALGATRPTSAIAQLAAVAFLDGDLELGGYPAERRFEVKVSLDDCLRSGLTVDEDSLEFWLFQPDAVRASVFKGKKRSLAAALSQFGAWLHKVGEGHDLRAGLRMWSHSTFDPPVLNNAYEAAEIKKPYPRTCFRDLTTKLEDVWGAKERIVWPARSGLAHDALHDSIHQADTLKLALRRERGLAAPDAP